MSFDGLSSSCFVSCYGSVLCEIDRIDVVLELWIFCSLCVWFFCGGFWGSLYCAVLVYFLKQLGVVFCAIFSWVFC